MIGDCNDKEHRMVMLTLIHISLALLKRALWWIPKSADILPGATENAVLFFANGDVYKGERYRVVLLLLR